MQVIYTEGPSALTLANGTVVQRGQPAEVEKDLAEKLLEQGWKRANKTEKEKD